MRALWLVIETVGSLLAIACVLRAYAHRIHLNPRNPLSAFVAALTDWLVRPLRRLVAPTPTMDWASVIAAFLLATLTATLFYVVLGGIHTPNPGAVLFVALVWLVRWTLYLVMGIVIVYAILSWVNPYAPLAPALAQLASPLLAPFRRVIPLVGGVDLSPLVLIIVVQVLLMLADPSSLPMMLR